MVFIVAHYRQAQAGDPPPTNGKIVAGWSLFGFAGGQEVIDLKRTGVVVQCDAPHETTKPYEARFWTCQKDARLAAMRARTNLDLADFRFAMGCEPGRLASYNGSRVALDEGCAQQVESKVGALLADDSLSAVRAQFAEFAKAFDDAAIDPYWFSCYLGCCTASDL